MSDPPKEEPASPDTPAVAAEPAQPAPQKEPVGLLCLGGQAPPTELGPALQCILRLPELVRERFGELLIPHLDQQPESQLDEHITTTCRQLDLPVDVAGVAIKASRLVFRQAAAYELSGEQLVRDLAQLGGDSKLVGVLLPLYEKVLPGLRREIYHTALASHGKLLTAVEWRIDSVGTTSIGRSVNLPVVFLTFQYQAGNKSKRITLQAQPEMIEHLRNVCSGLLAQ